MIKADLVNEVAENSHLTRTEAEIVVQTVLDSIVEALQSGDQIELRGFGSFRLRERKARLGRNPKTGGSVWVPARKIAYFKPGKKLRELINS